jgi:hypothetical protein
MKIEMTAEEYYDEGCAFLTGEGLRHLENYEEILFSYPDDSWLEEEMGETDNGPFGGHWYAMIKESDLSLFVLLRQSDFSREVMFFDSETSLHVKWENILFDAYKTAYENNDLDYFNLTEKDYLALLETVKVRGTLRHAMFDL